MSEDKTPQYGYTDNSDFKFVGETLYTDHPLPIRVNSMDKFIQTARDIIETTATSKDMHFRLMALAKDWEGTFPAQPMGLGRHVGYNENNGTVVIAAGHVVAYFKLITKDSPGLPGLIKSANLSDADAAIGIGIYTSGEQKDCQDKPIIYMSDMVHTYVNVDNVRKLLEFF